MIIGIDSHNLEGKRTGVGRVLINILRQWDSFDLPNNLEFILYFKNEIPDLDLSNRFEKRLLNSKSNALFIHCFLPQAAKKDKVDVLFCPGYIAPIFYSGKIALIIHDIIYQVHPEWYNWPSVWDRILLKRVSKISVKKAQVIFTPSEFTRQEVIKHYQVSSDKVIATLWSTENDFKQINDQNKLEEIKKKYQIKDKFIFYIGLIFTRRHLPEVIKAFKNISNKIPDYQFLIVGANHANISEEEFDHKKIIHQEYLPGKDLVELYNAADLTIYLSDYEGFGLPVLESMACGTPVITSNKTSIPEVAGQTAIYIQDNTNIQEIEKAIYRGLRDQRLRQDLINSGLAQASKFSWLKSAQKMLDALLRIK
ncbi:glycosyltransferase family 4 protein [Patescibacteria group bacterium]|nr:glycosyltransferase family 4 protein [Patescibacteria group bacterium]MBU1563666.1 glycosyltransferase family 4 protein [Patescibacteria group bacterium]MBU2068392.1 glycosyltransferase family 4 protein [Patescibacteria group bacterium]